MFKTQAGPVEGEGSTAYLRPETAQGMFTNFANVLTTVRKKPPFGIAQVGKSFRNEITPQNFVFRTREFEQMEMEYFVPPESAEEWYRYWIDTRFAWHVDLGIPSALLRLHAHAKEDLSHYSKGTTDIEFYFPWGWDELEGVANRGDYDLSQHTKFSGVTLDYFDPTTNERYTPYVIEPAVGATRSMMAFLLSAYHEDVVEGETRTVLKLDWRLAPYQIAVLPLSKKPELEGVSQEVLQILQPYFMCDYDVTQSIGRRYRRQDEIGTPYCVTIDFETLNDRAVTVRDRDTTEQVRVTIDELRGHFWNRERGELVALRRPRTEVRHGRGELRPLPSRLRPRAAKGVGGRSSRSRGTRGGCRHRQAHAIPARTRSEGQRHRTRRRHAKDPGATKPRGPRAARTGRVGPRRRRLV